MSVHIYDKSFEPANLLECVSSFEVLSLLVARWIVQEGDQAFGRGVKIIAVWYL
jgi:hypothetical protein